MFCRVTFGFELYDETGCIALTAFSEDATKLLGKDADALHNMAYEVLKLSTFVLMLFLYLIRANMSYVLSIDLIISRPGYLENIA